MGEQSTTVADNGTAATRLLHLHVIEGRTRLDREAISARKLECESEACTTPRALAM